MDSNSGDSIRLYAYMNHRRAAICHGCSIEAGEQAEFTLTELPRRLCRSRQSGEFAMPSRQSDGFGMPKSPKWQLRRAEVGKVATSACRSRESGDFGVPKSAKWRLRHAEVGKVAASACRRRQNFGMPKLSKWRMLHAYVATLAILACRCR